MAHPSLEPGSHLDEPREPAPPPRDPHAEAAAPDPPNVGRPSGETLPPTGPRPTSEPNVDEIPAPVRPVRSRTPTPVDTARRATAAAPPPTPDTPPPGGARPLPALHPSETGHAVTAGRQDTSAQSSRADGHQDGPAPHEPLPIAAQPATLPRLQPAPRADHAQAPEVTVNIGRIEVVPPRAMESTTPRETTTPRRTAGAPDLADYLRDRGRR